jgi:hypothetical protein
MRIKHKGGLRSSSIAGDFLNSSKGNGDIFEQLKRFNDVYTLLFVVITILLTVDITLFDSADFGLTVLFIVGSLGVWAFGHLLGAKTDLRHVEIQFKLIAWLYASLVASDVIVKFALRLSVLSGWWASLCIVVSVLSGLALFAYLRRGIKRRDRDELAVLVLVLLAALVLYVLYAQIVVF